MPYFGYEGEDHINPAQCPPRLVVHDWLRLDARGGGHAVAAVVAGVVGPVVATAVVRAAIAAPATVHGVPVGGGGVEAAAVVVRVDRRAVRIP